MVLADVIAVWQGLGMSELDVWAPIERWLNKHEQYDIRVGRYLQDESSYRATLVDSCYGEDNAEQDEEEFTAHHEVAASRREAVEKVSAWCLEQLGDPE